MTDTPGKSQTIEPLVLTFLGVTLNDLTVKDCLLAFEVMHGMPLPPQTFDSGRRRAICEHFIQLGMARELNAPTSEKEYRRLHPEKLRLYCVSIDEYRDATQDDMDNMCLGTQAYGRLREAMKKTQEWVDENLRR